MTGHGSILNIDVSIFLWFWIELVNAGVEANLNSHSDLVSRENAAQTRAVISVLAWLKFGELAKIMQLLTGKDLEWRFLMLPKSIEDSPVIIMIQVENLTAEDKDKFQF